VTPSRTRTTAAPAPDHEAAIAGAQYSRHRRTHRSRGHQRPRLLQLLATGGNGGAQESYTGLLLRLDRSKYEVRALSLSAGSAVQRIRRLGIQVDVIDEADDEAAIRELAAWLRREEIDLVHAHMYRAEVLGTRAALAAGTPVIMATVHSSRVRSPEDQAALAALTPAMDRLVVPSASILAKVRSEGRGGAAYSIVPNGVDLSRFEVPAPRCALRRESGVPGSAVLVGVVARLEPEKGHTHLVAAWPDVVAAAPDAWLAIVGEGSACAALRAQAAALPAPARDRIIFTGRREDVSALTADLDIAVLPSLREAQGISILEAMARRKPVVASAVGGIPEVVADGVSGLLVPPGDPLALSAALSRLAASPALRASMGEAGYRIVVDRFSMEAHVRRIESIYDEELSRAGALASLGNGSGPLRRSGEPPRERSALEVPPV
jgi:glycosyltransferase involved in cell wall biosynthesis